MKLMKSLMLLTFIVILATGLAACGSSQSAGGTGKVKSNADSSGKSTTNSTKTTDSTKSSNSTTTDSTASTDNAASKTNLHGRTITIAAWWDAGPTDQNLQGKEMLAQQKKVEQEYNVKIKYINAGWGGVNKKLISSVIAGKPYADVVKLTSTWAFPDIAKNLLLPLNSFAPDMSKYKHYAPLISFKGTAYGFDDPNAGETMGIFYNLDIMKKYGLSDPQQLAKAGKWNWSNFEKLAKQATIDTNNDGKPDVWGLAGWTGDNWGFFQASDNALMVDGNGNVNLTNPNVIESLDFYQKLFRDGVWEVQPKSTLDNVQERKTFGMGHAFMTPTFDWGTNDFKNINYGFVPFPTGPHGTGFVEPKVNPSTWFIPKGIKNPEAVMEVFNALQDINSTESYSHQTEYENDFKRQSDIDWARKVFPHKVMLYSTSFDGFPTGDIIHTAIVKNKDVTAVLKQYQPKAKSIVDKILNPPQ